MVCRNIFETFPSAGPTGYFEGILYCSKCVRFLHSDKVICNCCKSNLRTKPYDRNAKEKRKIPVNGQRTNICSLGNTIGPNNVNEF